LTAQSSLGSRIGIWLDALDRRTRLPRTGFHYSRLLR
jgi:hypothetical protein